MFDVRCFSLSLTALLFVLVTSCSKEKPTNPEVKTTNATSVISTNPAAVNGPRPLQFPKDEGVHSLTDYPFEWWYLNSQFTDVAGKKYSFVFSTFSTGRHLVSLYDKSGDSARAKDYYESVKADENKLDLTSITGDWKQTAEPFAYNFKYDYEGVTVELKLKATKKPFLPGENGFVAMGEKGTSYYYALTDLTLIGTLKNGSNQPPVQIIGSAWMDHQWGKWDWINDFHQWKWYSVKLDNGVDLMLFNLYKNKKLLNSHCGYIDAKNNQVHNLPCELVTKQFFTDERGGKWQKEVDLEFSSLPNTKLTLISEKDEQFIEPFVLWEGSMKVTGSFKGTSVKGTAFGELNRPD